MSEPFQTALYALSAGLFLLTVGYVVLGRLPDNLMVGGFALLELALVTQLLVGVVQLVATERDVPAFTFVGYLVGVLLILPLGLVWAVGEKSRSGTAVLLVAIATVPFLIYRTEQIWAAGA